MRRRMSAIGTKRTFNCRSAMSAFGGKADIAVNFALSRPVKTPDSFCFVVISPDGFAAPLRAALVHRGAWRFKRADVALITST
jgi:hypothetical protein